ncbi:nucleotide disphospho-sugar-binding domain-containing protein [Herbiconiux sp. YIM B11900]|uniref:nucleotide disphospho-sugar-binding domain-containing protein n=1 Tax=Herbiconiux sp. YIM B11900 TaxID=3404131 RepID=UPI003F855CF7
MTLLVISPDYASHLLPLATIAGAWHERGERVVVATGEATDGIVRQFGYERVPLQLGRGSNPGVIRAGEQPREEGDSLRGFFEATRRGMLPTLRYQAEERLTDLMWQPVQKARETIAVVEAVQPDAILVDHLAFSARLGLAAAGVTYADVVLGHPSALPVGDELYGFPAAWPAAFAPDRAELAELRAICARVSNSFTAEWNTALAELNPSASPTGSAFAETGDLLLFNYPAELADPERAGLLPEHTYLGSMPRDDSGDAEVDAWLAGSRDPYVYVSFGSFLSVRDDVLAVVAAALRTLGVRAAIATGSGDPARLGTIPPDWLVREYLPQVSLLRGAAASITHGGNNSVTEAAGFGVPMLVLPFSTDQFAGAAALERAGAGLALDPNTVTPGEIRDAVGALLDDGFPGRAELNRIAAGLARTPGPERAFDAIGARLPARA